MRTTASDLPARYVEVRIPDDFDTDECLGGRYVTWRTVAGVERHHQPGEVSRIWVVEVGFPSSLGYLSGSYALLVIDATSHGEPPPEGLAELADPIDSLRIEPGEETR